MKIKPSAFIVLYDGELLRYPYMWDSDCLGALRVLSGGPVALFATRKRAQQAIRISARYAALCQAQGKPVNTDFTTGLQNVRVVPCSPQPI